MRLLATLIICLALAGTGPAAACYTSNCFAPSEPPPATSDARCGVPGC